MKLLIALLLCISSFPTSAMVYIGAHPDDIALFMNRNASKDVYTGYRVVFIVISAGDAGYRAGAGGNVVGIPYYRARLLAHESAVKFWISLSGSRVGSSIYGTEKVNGKLIEKIDIGPAVTLYNLNLPDGAGESIDGQSLSNLLGGQLQMIQSIDGNSSYTLNDLTSTIRTLIERNHQGTQAVWVNFQNEDASKNTNDHPDHLAAGRITAMALSQDARFSCVDKARFLDYVISGLQENLTTAERNIHIGTWGAINAALVENGNANTWDDGHNAFLGRQYATGESGAAPCSF